MHELLSWWNVAVNVGWVNVGWVDGCFGCFHAWASIRYKLIVRKAVFCYLFIVVNLLVDELLSISNY